MNRAALERRITLEELLDRVLEKGVVINGDVTISVADVDLIYLGLRLILTSVENLYARESRFVGERSGYL